MADKLFKDYFNEKTETGTLPTSGKLLVQSGTDEPEKIDVDLLTAAGGYVGTASDLEATITAAAFGIKPFTTLTAANDFYIANPPTVDVLFRVTEGVDKGDYTRIATGNTNSAKRPFIEKTSNIDDVDQSKVPQLSLIKEYAVSNQEFVDIIIGKNKANPANIVSGTYYSPSANQLIKSATWRSIWLEVLEGQQFTVSGTQRREIGGFSERTDVADTNAIANLTGSTFIVPAGVNWVLIAITNQNTDSFNSTIQIEEGASATAYEAYTETKFIKNEKIPAAKSDIQANNSKAVNSDAVIDYALDRNDYERLIIGKNAIDKSKIVSGSYYSPGGGDIREGATWRRTNYIPVEEGQTWTVSGRNRSDVGGFANHGDTTVLVNLSGSTFTVPAGVNFVVLNITNSDVDTFNDTVQMELGTVPTSYEAYNGGLFINPEKIRGSQTGTIQETDSLRLVIPSKNYAIESVEFTTYLQSLFITQLGDSRDNYFIDVVGNLGRHYERFLRTVPTAANAGITYNTSFNFYHKNAVVGSGTTTIQVASINSGNGVTKKIMVLGASKSTKITPFIKEFFDGDVMNAQFVGTIGNLGEKHEARSGWSFAKYNTDGGAFFRFNLTNQNNPPQLDDVYSNNSSEFTITEINITDGNGYVSGERTSGTNNPILTASNLTKVSGNGGVSISYDNAEINATNPFWNNTTMEFDFAKYMADTSQSMAAGDWVMIELGTNDIFSRGAVVEPTLTNMKVNAKKIIDSIHDYNSEIKIGVVTIPTPASSQDAFGDDYGNKYPREIFMQNGWYLWNRYLLDKYDANTVTNIHVVNSHLSVDFDLNYPRAAMPINQNNTETISMQNNALHPNNDGYKQMIAPYVAIIKNIL